MPAKVSCGWSLKNEEDRVVVTRILDGRPAQQAGIGIDDEVVAVNGKRVTSKDSLDSYLEEAAGDVELTCSCDGRMYTTTLSPEPVTSIKLTRVENPSDRQKMLMEKWLAR